MKLALARVRRLFPGKAFYLLILSFVATFAVGIFDLLGVAAILPIIQIATGEDYTTGYLGTISKILGNPDRNHMVVYVSLILVLAFVLKAIFSLAIRWWSTGFLAKQQAAAATTLMESYLKDSYFNHRKRQVADIIRNTSDATTQAYTFYVGGILGIVGEGATIVLLMILLIAMMPLHATIAFIYFILATYILQKALQNKNKKAGELSLAMNWKSTYATLDAANGFRENKIHGITDRRIFDYQDARIQAVEALRARTFYQDLPKYLLEIVFIIGIVLILGLMIMTGGIESAAYLLVFAGACVRILPSFVRLTATSGGVRVGAPAMAIVDEEIQLLNTPELKLKSSDPDIAPFNTVHRELASIDLKVSDLSFRYPDGTQNILDHLSFAVPSGTSIAFVGGSGSGKTTLIDILLGLYQPSDGQVTYNGKDVHSNVKEWNNYVGYVPQDVYLSSKSVLEEIAFGLRPEEIDEARVWECIRIAELTDVIESLEENIHTKIGENGTRLSGGQRQRLGIARAIYRNPSVLILDEATSALDNDTEHKITQTINELAKQITVIIVAHRLSTVREVDQLLYMRQGHIVAQGTFEEVRNSSAEFAHLVSLGQLPE